MYKLVLLDLDGTILDYDKAERSALTKVLEKNNIYNNHSSYITKYKEINSKIWEDYEQGKIGKDDLRVERFRKLLKEELTESKIIEVSKKYLDYIAMGGYKITGATDICKYLSDKYRVIALTNGIRKVQVSRMKNSNLERYIEGMVTPGDAGIQKPHPAIFRYTLDKYSHRDKESVLIIGDSLTSDIKGGNDFGIDTCWVNLKKKKSHVI